MWHTIEQNIDGMVGRMMSWLTQAPVRAVDLAEEPVTEEPAAEEPTRLIAEIVGEPEDRSAGDGDQQEEKIVERLSEAASGAGATMKELQRQTGETPYALRQRMNRLIEAGQVKRKGKGMRTRYHWVEDQ